MPQSTTGSVTQECHLRCIKDGDELQILAVSGCEFVNGVLRAEIGKDQDRLLFTITDFDGYEIRASSAIGTGPFALWSTPAPGEHWSPALDRDPQRPPADTYTVAMTLSFEIRGPDVPPATVVKPPTTVVIRSRLGDPDLVGG